MRKVKTWQMLSGYDKNGNPVYEDVTPNLEAIELNTQKLRGKQSSILILDDVCFMNKSKWSKR